MGTIARRRRPTRTRPLRVTIRRRRIISRGAVGTRIHNATTPARLTTVWRGRRGRQHEFSWPPSSRRVPRGPTDYPTRPSDLANRRRGNRRLHSQDPDPVSRHWRPAIGTPAAVLTVCPPVSEARPPVPLLGAAHPIRPRV